MKSSRLEICRIKKSDIIASIEIERDQNRKEKGGKGESEKRAFTSV